MKTLKQFLAHLSFRGLAMAGALLGASVQSDAAVTSDPSQNGSFTWDLLSSGAGEKGLAFMTFTSDGTFHGYQMLAATPPPSAGTNSSSDGRGGGSVDRGGGSIGRTGGGGTNGVVLFFGFSPVNGTWVISSKGKLVGTLNQTVQVTSVVTNYLASTNTFVLVNGQTSETTNVTVVFATGQPTSVVSVNWPNPPPGFTQSYTLTNTSFTTGIGSTQVSDTVSFTGKAVFNKSLTLVCSTGSGGHITYNGVPAPTGTTVDLSGDWIGTRKQNGTKINEVFSLVSFQVDNPFPSDFPDIAEFPNLYFTTNGLSGSTGFIGIAMLSRQKHIGFTFNSDGNTLRSMIGTLKPTKFGPTATTKGIEEPNTLVNFTATLQ